MAARLSYICNPMNTPYMYQSIPDRLRCLATEDPERMAFVFYDFDGNRQSVTRREVYKRSEQLAKHFVGFGMRKGSWVGVCMNNSLNMLYVIFGVSLAGGIPFFLATNLKDGSDLIENLNDMKGEFLIIDASEFEPNWDILDKIWPTGEPVCDVVPTLKCVICNGRIPTQLKSRVSLGSLLDTSAPDKMQLPTVFPEDTALCFCTSGSTGKPKVVICSHYGILNWTKQCEVGQCFTKDTIFFGERPFGWAGGAPRPYVTVGCTHVFVDTRMTLSGKYVNYVCDIIEKEKVSVAYIPRYVAMDLLNNPHLASKFKTLIYMLMGGERFTQLLLPLKDMFCQNLVIWYGNTENGGSVSFYSNRSEDYEEGLIGFPAPGAEIKIIDNNGDVVPFGELGEMCIRSTWRFVGYKNMPELLRCAVDAVGWFHSGDIAHIRPDGNIVIDGRKQDLITMQTVKYFPWDIEKTLRKCPAVKEVVAVGVPDTRLNQVICACVVPEVGENFTENSLKEFCNDHFLPEATSAGLSLKPKYHLIFDDIPLTSSGKIDRRRIGLLAKEKLNL